MAAEVGHRGNYLKLITLLPGKPRISEKDYFGWSFVIVSTITQDRLKSE